MGRASNPGLNAIVLSPDNLPRILFNAKVIRLTEARIQAYWAQMRISEGILRMGRRLCFSQPPDLSLAR